MKKSEKLSSKKINQASVILKRGGVVIFPTDTVYGIGCCTDCQKAIERIYQIKGTPQNLPFPILVSNISQVEKIAKVTPLAQNLIKKYWPGALTIILQSKDNGEKIGFRLPNSPIVLSLINKLTVPIIGTSANSHGKSPVAKYEALDENLVKLTDFVIKGQCQLGVESTVVDATVEPFRILRQGALNLS